MKRRIFIESDILHEDALRSAQRSVVYFLKDVGEEYIPDVFDEALDFAWHDLTKTWEAVKKADEIYADTSLLPIVGGVYMGAPVIFNGMMERAIKEGIKGKSVFILRPQASMDWYMIDVGIIKKAFKYNKLFFYEDGMMMLVNYKEIKKR